MSFTLWPKIFVIRASQAARRRRRAFPPCALALSCLGFLTIGILPAQPRANNPPVTSQFEKPVQLDYFQREDIQRQARQNTERFRMRVTLPPAAFESRPAGDSTGSAIRDKDADASAEFLPKGTANLVTRFLCVLGALAFWVLAARKLVPDFAESVTSWLPSRSLRPSLATDRLVTLLAEEKSVSEFQAALRSGHAPGAGAAEESADSRAAEENLFSTAAGHIHEMQRLLREAGVSMAQTAQRRFLLEALDEIAPLKHLARPAELLPLRQVTCAVEMLLKQLTEKTSNMTSSALRTAALGATMLEELCQPGLKPDLLSEPPLRVLVVDDETFSRYALAHSLKRGLGEPEVAETGEFALTLAARRAYDLILLDVQMPGMDGFELCSRIHETGPNRTTPVVFVTSLRDFDARANSILCGGRDLIAKPFLTFELTVKALTLVARERLRGHGRTADASVDESQAVTPTLSLPEAASHFAGDDAGAGSGAVPALEPTPAPSVPATASESDGAVPRPEPAAVFFVHARAQIDMIRGLVELIRNAPDQRVQRQMITDLLLGVHLLAVTAGDAGQHSIALMASSLEGLLNKLHENLTNLSASTLQAVATATALIQDLCTLELGPGLAVAPPIRALVVDDDPVVLRALTSALQMRFSRPESASDGQSALALAAEKPFDVIFLDVQMPDFDGFEVCARIQKTSANCRTPVVFLTGHAAPTLRAKSELCGGADFLAKSCLGSELTLKALSFALRKRLQNTWGTAPECPVELQVNA